MIIKSVFVENFRCLKQIRVNSEPLTVFVGPNGSGKSSLMRALDLFYQPRAAYNIEDFYANNTSEKIIIRVTFTLLTEEEKELFEPYIEGDELTIEKVLSWPRTGTSQKYFGSRLSNPDFDAFRNASGSDLRKEYGKLTKKAMYAKLPSYSNKENAESALRKWEQANPDQCERRRDDGQFFGFKEVGEARLERYTRFILIPAVRDASEEASEGRGSILSGIMDLVVRNALAQRDEYIKLCEETQCRYDEIMDPDKLPELKTLATQLTENLRNYVSDTAVHILWEKGEGLAIPLPRANVELVEDGYLAKVDHVGHGLQRAFILTLFQYLATMQPTTTQDREEPAVTAKMPNLIIAIEEPELYQHPNRQRHLARTLYGLSTGRIPGVAEKTQVIYSTHSPLLMDLERFNQIRIFRKVLRNKDEPKETTISQATLHKVAEILEKAHCKPKGTYTEDSLKPHLQTLMTPQLNEGFFADLAVIVEGTNDQAIIQGISYVIGHDLLSKGITVLRAGGKNSIDYAYAIFRTLQIPVYVIWDSDKSKGDPKHYNHRLLRLLGQKVENFPVAVTNGFACFEENMIQTFSDEVGHKTFEKSLKKCCSDMDLTKQQVFMNPKNIVRFYTDIKKQGKSSKTIETIISKIV